MRMVHYYLGLGLALALALVLTLVSGTFRGELPADLHLVLGLFTAVLSVATNTLLILFMIVTGRILKQAMQARDLGGEFLRELNLFFARRRAYPAAILSACAAAAAAVLGYGRFIGVPAAVHMLVGLGAVIGNLFTLSLGLASLRANQGLLDRAARELDRLDAASAPLPARAGEPAWRFSPGARWLIFSASAWGPYLYWSLVVWRGDFAQVPALFALLSLAASLLGLACACRSRVSSSRTD
jgi:hypothetical protein